MLGVRAWIEELRRPLLYEPGAPLWTDPYIAGEMLKAHLSPDSDAASYRPETIRAICAFLPAAMELAVGSAIVDVGCGPGLYCHQLAEQGFTVTGLDGSENSLRYARRLCAGQSVRFKQGNYLEPFGAEEFDAAVMIWHDFGVLSPAQRNTLLANIGASLKPGGWFAFDVPSLAAFAQKQATTACDWESAQKGFWRPHPYVALHAAHLYPEIHAACDLFAVLDDEPTLYRIWQTYFSPASLREELQESEFTVKAIWADLTGVPWSEESHAIGVLCQKA